MVDNCIYCATIGNMPFIQFPFIEVPKELRKLVGEQFLADGLLQVFELRWI